MTTNLKIKYVLFDLDGTLLPMDQDEFAKSYFKGLATKLAPFGYEPKQLVDSIWQGTAAMVKNDGNCKNEDAFWSKFTSIYGERALKDKPILDDFYLDEFDNVKNVCGFSKKPKEIIDWLKSKGCKCVLATNPIFPSIATEKRMAWAGLEKQDFTLYTTYENMSTCKPNPQYYLDILRIIGATPDECIMIGNDVTEDMIAQKLGLKVFLLTDNIINKQNIDIKQYPHGSFIELWEFLKENI